MLSHYDSLWGGTSGVTCESLLGHFFTSHVLVQLGAHPLLNHMNEQHLSLLSLVLAFLGEATADTYIGHELKEDSQGTSFFDSFLLFFGPAVLPTPSSKASLTVCFPFHATGPEVQNN